MVYAIVFFVIVIIFNLLKNQSPTKQSKLRKTNSTVSKGSINYYEGLNGDDDKWSMGDSNYDGGGSDSGSGGD